MKDKMNIFDLKPPVGHAARIEDSVANILKQKRTEERRKLFSWLLVPAFASIAGIIIWNKKRVPDADFVADQDLLQNLENDADLELIADLELLDDLETLEDWDGSEET